MPHQDALRDNIRFTGGLGTQYYYPPCCLCGAEVKSWGYISNIQYICNDCKEQIKIKRTQERKSKAEAKRLSLAKAVKEKTVIVKTQEIARMSRALERISKITDLAKYAKAIEKVNNDIDAGAVFGSTEELLVGLELTRQGVQYRQQVQFGRYRADFVLDAYKIVLEIDGKLYHSKMTKPKEGERDNFILGELGQGWDVIHISDDNVNEHVTQITKAITKVLEHRKLMKARAVAYRYNTQPV